MIKRVSLLCLGWLCVVLAVCGIFLPLLPTVPFLLAAAWAFTQGSPKAKQWLFNHPRLGPLVKQWSGQKAIPRSIKIRAILSIWAGMILSMLIVKKLWPIIMLVTIGACVTIYIWRKPEPISAPSQRLPEHE